MFHGPSYQGITHLDGIGPRGARGRLVVTDAPGALLDNAGQIYGYWATQYLDVDSLLLPQAVTEMRFYGPNPAVGDRLTCVARIRDVAARTVTADLVLRAADGTVWCEIIGWTDRRFTANAWLWLLMREPERNTVAEPRPDGWVVVPDFWRDMASRELIVRHFLDADRRKVLAGKNPRAGKEWLLGRIAAQDAVRRWLWSRGAGPVWGIEVVVDNDPAGRPVVTRLPDRPDQPAGPPPNLSIAHKVDLAVALVDAEGDVGIDLETVAVRTAGALAAGLTPSERAMLAELTATAQVADEAAGDEAAGDEAAGDEAADDEAGELARGAWFARLWAAKEAAAKADGTGLQGRPRRFVVDLVVPAGAADAGELGPAGGPAALLGPDQVTSDGIKSPPPRPVVSTVSEPPLLLRVAILPAGPTGDGGLAADGPDGTGEPGHAVPSRHRWVALRTVDGAGRVRRETADPVRLGDHVVAWTSPAVERAARARRPREASS
jgi:phosphopantetheinyl transferase